MKDDTLKLNDQQVLEYARTGLEQHVHLQADGYSCTAEDLWNVLDSFTSKAPRDWINSIYDATASALQPMPTETEDALKND